MKRLLFATTIIVASITGCAAAEVQQSSGNDLEGNSKIILADRTGNVDGHKTPFAKEYVVAAGNHVVGVCGGGALCEKFYYIKFDTKPGFTYTVYNQARNISVSNQAGYLIDTQGFGNQLRDGIPAVISFNDSSARSPAGHESNTATSDSNHTVRKDNSSVGNDESPATEADQRIVQALRRGDSAAVEAAIQAGGDPNVIRLRDILDLPYASQPAMISIMHRHGVDWRMSSNEVLTNLVDRTMLQEGMTEQQYLQGKLAVVDALIAAGFRFSADDISNATRQHMELQQGNALTLLHHIAAHSGNEKAYMAEIDQFDARRLATEKNQHDAQQAAATQARVVGTKICKSVPGTWRRALGTSLGHTVYGNEQATTYFVTGFTEGTSGTRIQIRIAGIQAPTTSAEFQNVDRIGGDTVLAVNNVIWDDAVNWKPCD
ncbi:hypothetical protein [Paraburkholderia sp. ZP32-5]|uniref:hypothetical protein n=1 Tax=Paraburkholderia sp. ZP32-5 TaxID=2883245 RepID=UPI001F30064E|nr:hypothetical protein [Paraburkholderia sp. ZP32-5]